MRKVLRIIFILVGIFFFLTPAYAGTLDELRDRIASRNTELLQLEKEIERYQIELDTVSKEKQTLQGAISILDISRKKLTTNTRVTENRIAATDLRISELDIEIKDKEERIGEGRGGVGSALRTLDELDSDSPVETLLRGDTLSSAWNHMEQINRFQILLRARVVELAEFKNDLERKKEESEKSRKNLIQLRTDLANQKRALDTNREEKTRLLSITKNTEANYQKLLNEKIEQREQFEEELTAFESELRLTIDPNSLPRTGSGILRWPLDLIFITQYFGSTLFASKNPQIYNGKGHNGIDLRAGPGTRIKSALDGIIEGVGDTDRTCANASYGKWVLVRHGNGLTTLYAHLSLITVTEGQSVGAGEVVGYSGNTGYSTGPHLHFAVFATQGVRIGELPSKARSCRGRIYTLPLADFRAYLNPLSYL